MSWCHIFWNLSHETVPLNEQLVYSHLLILLVRRQEGRRRWCGIVQRRLISPYESRSHRAITLAYQHSRSNYDGRGRSILRGKRGGGYPPCPVTWTFDPLSKSSPSFCFWFIILKRVKKIGPFRCHIMRVWIYSKSWEIYGKIVPICVWKDENPRKIQTEIRRFG